jgi:phosphate:Na+ symporter
MSRQLGRRFSSAGDTLLHHIKDADLSVSEAAIENVSQETLRLIDQAAALNQLSFGLPVSRTFYDSTADRLGVRLFGDEPNYGTAYDNVKQLEGDILSYAIRLQSTHLDEEESVRLGQIIIAIRNAVHAAKCLKDTHHDLQSFQDSVDDRFNAWFGRFRDAANEFYELFGALQMARTSSHQFEMLVEMKHKNEEIHSALHKEIYREVAGDHLSEVQISTLLNVNRELYLSNQSLSAALADALLDTHGATDFESLPVGG